MDRINHKERGYHDIRVVSPRNNARVCKEEMTIVGKVKTVSMRYNNTNQMSIDYVAALVREEPISNKHFADYS